MKLQEEKEATKPIGFEPPVEILQEEVRPVCGWLICIEGARVGMDYKIYKGKNFVGRGDDMDIRILGDNEINRKNHTIIVYDAKKLNTMVVTFAQKVYQSPKKPWTLKRVLMIAIPVVLVTGGISLALFLRYRSIRNKEKNLMECMENGEAYLRYDNYQRAAEEYGEAKTLAGSLNRDEEYEKADRYKKLAVQVILADEALSDGEYEKSQELYLTARELSEDAGNVGRIYIESQLDRAKDYIEVYDLIALGERKEEYGNLKGAIAAYKEAREKAADLYYGDGKAEALEKQAAAEEALEKAEMEEESRKKEQEKEIAAEVARQQQEEAAAQELDNQQKANDQQNAIDLENQGNSLLAQGQYESAITFYQTAQAIYKRLDLTDLANNLNPKIEAARAGMAAAVPET